MRGTYPSEVRVRVIGLVEAGASRREAAEQLEVSEGLELAARIARARERMNRLEFASDDNESKQAAGTMAGPDEK